MDDDYNVIVLNKTEIKNIHDRKDVKNVDRERNDISGGFEISERGYGFDTGHSGLLGNRRAAGFDDKFTEEALSAERQSDGGRYKQNGIDDSEENRQYSIKENPIDYNALLEDNEELLAMNEEIAANACFTVFSEQANFESLVKENKSLARKVRDFFADFIEKIKNALNDISTRNAEYKALKDDISAKEKILAMFNECLKAYDVNVSEKSTEIKFSKKIREAVLKVIENKGVVSDAHNTIKLFEVPSDIAEYVSASSENSINISNKVFGINAGQFYHEYNQHSNETNEISKDQIPLTPQKMERALMAFFEPDIVEALATDTNNRNQQQSFVYAKKDNDNRYIVVVAVGGKNNPTVVPAEIFDFSANKWNKYLNSGKTLAEFVYENDKDMLSKLDINKIKKNRIIVAEYNKSNSNPHSLRFNNIISNSKENVKFSLKEDSEGNKLSIDVDEFSEEDYNYPKLSRAEYNHLKSEILTNFPRIKNVKNMINLYSSNSRYYYILDDDYNVMVLAKTKIKNIHDRKDIKNVDRERNDIGSRSEISKRRYGYNRNSAGRNGDRGATGFDDKFSEETLSSERQSDQRRYSENDIDDSEENRQYSIKENPIDYNALLEDNEELLAMNEDLQRMLKLTFGQGHLQDGSVFGRRIL